MLVIRVSLVALSWIIGAIMAIAATAATVVVTVLAYVALNYFSFILGIVLSPLVMIGFVILGVFGGSGVEGISYNRLPESDFYSGAEVTDTWRSLHPYGYNPFTGGSSAEEDRKNGW